MCPARAGVVRAGRVEAQGVGAREGDAVDPAVPGHLTTHGDPMAEDHGTDFDGLAEAYARMATALPLRA